MYNRARKTQDLFRIMGFPSAVNLHMLKDSQAVDLIGEGVSLGCMATCLYAAVLSPARPWWEECSPAKRPCQAAPDNDTAATA